MCAQPQMKQIGYGHDGVGAWAANDECHNDAMCCSIMGMHALILIKVGWGRGPTVRGSTINMVHNRLNIVFITIGIKCMICGASCLTIAFASCQKHS